MRTTFIAAALVLSSFAGAASAQPATYNLDPSHTFPRFSYNHFGLSTQQSRFNNTTGTVMFDKAAKTGAVDVVIDMKAVDTGFAAFNGHIQGEDFLDTTKFPTATFKSTKVVFDGDKPSSVEGNLTIKGITKPATLKVVNFVSTTHPMNKKEVIGAEATTTIKRTEFNAGKFAPYVGDDVTITIALEAIKQ
jgi:polyisoprenoid-binding protein YceI